MMRLTTLGLLSFVVLATGCPSNDCETDGTCDDTDTSDTDTDSDTSDTDTDDTDTGDTGDTGDTDDTGDTGDTGEKDPCDDQGRFQCEGGTNLCARVCGTIGGKFLQYYVDERMLLSEFTCNIDNDRASRILLGDRNNEKYLLVNIEDEKLTSEGAYTNPMGVSAENSQVEFSQDDGVRASWGTNAPHPTQGQDPVYGKGDAQVLIWNQAAPDGDGAVLMRLIVTEAYAKKDGKLELGNESVKTGEITIEIQGICKP